MKKYIVITIIVLVLITIGVMSRSGGLGISENQTISITDEEIQRGWYYGESDQKKLGTPSDWRHRGEGTRSASWYNPIKLLRECPDEKILNLMPGTETSENPSEYYIKNGVRKEVSEYDVDWVDSNCTVPVQKVY